MALFPKTLPRAAARRDFALEINKSEIQADDRVNAEVTPSFSEMANSFKRLFTNVTYMCNNFAAVFYIIGYMPYWIYMPKYIENQYRKSAATSSLVTGAIGLVFSAVAILASGFVISKYKPKARVLALWNVIVGLLSVAGIISYVFLGCATNGNQLNIPEDRSLFSKFPCNENCGCDYVGFNQVCTENGEPFISPCHAGCRSVHVRVGNKC